MWVFLTWWFAQLAGLLPAFLTRGSTREPDAVILDIGTDLATLLIRARGTTASITQGRADEVGMRDFAKVLREDKPVPSVVLLRFPPEAVLSKHLTFPAVARRDLKNLLGFEIDRETPFARDEIYWSHTLRRQDPAHGRLEVELFLVPRWRVDPVIELARRAGLDPAGIEVESGGQRVHLIPIAVETPHAGQREWPLVWRAAAAGAFALIAIAAPFAYQEWAIASADATIASLQAQADEATALRQSADQLVGTAEFFKKNDRGENSLAMLAAITRSLPEDSYLTGLTLRGTRLTISGLSPAAAQLVGLFARSPLFREPSFDSPVVGSEDGDLERFTISVSLARAETQ